MMKRYNWQLDEWPVFTFKKDGVSRTEATYLKEMGVTDGASKHLLASVQESLTIEILTKNALGTSKIEGESLDRDSVQSSVRRELGLGVDKRKVKPAESGIAEMMVDVFKCYAEPLSRDVLCRWHGMVARGRTDLETVGEYRSHEEPMRVVSVSGEKTKIHFEAPPSKRVPAEMERFIEWFNTDNANGPRLPVLVRAGIAHLWFESIHPFEDGNGRIGRAVAEKALMRGLSQPIVTALSPTLLARRKEYYAMLEQSSRSLEITPWILWFGDVALESARAGLEQVEFLIAKTRMFDSLRDALNPRQEKALLRMFAEGTDGFKGGMSAGKYAALTGAAPATVTRDLADLVAKGALLRTGEKKASRYHLNIPGMSWR